MKFVFDDDDIAFVKADVPKSGTTLEIRKLEPDTFTIFWYCDDCPYECGVFNKQELKVLWKMLSSK